MRGLSSPTLVLVRPSFPWLTATVVLVADAASKAIAQMAWTNRTVEVGPLRFHVTGNAGVSFSWLSSLPVVGLLLVVVSAVAVLSGAMLARPGWASLGFGLLVGGAVGNLADRIGLSSHHVVDFIGVGTLFVCNMADVAITFGVIVLGVLLLRGQSMTR